MSNASGQYTDCLYYWITTAEYQSLRAQYPELVNHFGMIDGVDGRYYAKASDLMGLDEGADYSDYDGLGDVLNYEFELRMQYFTRSTEPNLNF